MSKPHYLYFNALVHDIAHMLASFFYYYYDNRNTKITDRMLPLLILCVELCILCTTTMKMQTGNMFAY